MGQIQWTLGLDVWLLICCKLLVMNDRLVQFLWHAQLSKVSRSQRLE